jgi:hypothetical protein
MPQGNYSFGTYFDVHWPNYGINAIPTLTYGKHAFTITVKAIDTMYNSQGYQVQDSLPNLKKGSRILFEFKDAGGNTIFSDNTPIRQYDGFTNYIWIKEDPVRTYQDIQEGYGTLTVVAKTDNPDINWRNKYNIRSQQSIYISLYNADNIFYMNESPILFQNTTGSMGSGSGLTITENSFAYETNLDVAVSHANISCSKLRTYSGEVNVIKSYIQVSQSGDISWQFLGDHLLKLGGNISNSSSYEDGIYKNYGQGINPLSDHWDEIIPDTILSYEQDGDDGGGEQPVHRCKFKLEFVNPTGDIAKQSSSGSGEADFVLIYPTVHNEWMEFWGSAQTKSQASWQRAEFGWRIRSSLGQFSFSPKNNSSISPNSSKGQTFDGAGNVTIPPGDIGRGS